MSSSGVDRGGPRLAGAEDGEHLVGFYDSEEFLTDAVVEFVTPAIAAGDHVVAIVTAAHGQQLRAALQEQGVAVDALCDGGHLRIFDAEEMLARLLVDGMPHAQRFRALVGGLFDDAIAAGRSVRACGEMVAVLWESGNVAAMIALEDLWNELLSSRPVALLCPYPMLAFGRESSEAIFHRVCDAHTVVLPSERYGDLTDPDQRSRAVAVLQHEAVVGINERVALRQTVHEREAELQRLRALDRLRRRLLQALTGDSGAGAAAGDHDVGIEALRKTAVRQIRAVLGAGSCAFLDGAAGLHDDTRVVVPVSSGAVTHGVLRIELPAGRRLDDHELDFLQAAAETLAAALSAAHR